MSLLLRLLSLSLLFLCAAPALSSSKEEEEEESDPPRRRPRPTHLYVNSSCHRDGHRWEVGGVGDRIREWLDSAVPLEQPVGQVRRVSC